MFRRSALYLSLLLLCVFAACANPFPSSRPAATHPLQGMAPASPAPTQPAATHTPVAIGSASPPPARLSATDPIPSPATDAAPPGMTMEQKAARVDAIFGQYVQGDQPGGSIIVIQDGKTQYKAAYGISDLDKQIPLSSQSLFHIGSIAKPFTALGVMMLAEERKLAYDDPVVKYLPELAHFGNQITLRNLLNHTSGLPEITEEELTARSPYPDNTVELNVLASKPALLSRPGEKFAYSNTGYEMLALVIERVSGRPYKQFMQERIFTPLGMAHTFSLPDLNRFSHPGVAHSYAPDDPGSFLLVPYDSTPLDFLVGAASVYSSVEDLALFDAALYTDRLVKPSTLAEALKPARLNDGSESQYGFGWMLGELQGEATMRHGGRWMGFTGNYLRIPGEHLSVIVLLNRGYPPMDAQVIADWVAQVYMNP